MDQNLTFKVPIRVESAFVHSGRRLRTSALLHFFQVSALAHVAQLGADRTRTLDRGLLWVVVRQKIEIGEWPELGEDLVLSTRPAPMIRAFFPRVFEIARAAQPDEPVIRAEALWVLMDEQARALADPKAYDIIIPGAEGASAPSILRAVRRPGDTVTVSETRHTVKFSQTDVNGHLGHVYYFDLLDDLLFEGPAESESAGLLSGTFPRLIEAEYLDELRYGDEFVIRHELSEGPSGRVHFFTAGAAGSSSPAFRIRMS